MTYNHIWRYMGYDVGLNIVILIPRYHHESGGTLPRQDGKARASQWTRWCWIAAEVALDSNAWLVAHRSYPLVMTNVAIENGHLWWVFPLRMVIFHSYVSLPEGSRLLRLDLNTTAGFLDSWRWSLVPCILYSAGYETRSLALWTMLRKKEVCTPCVADTAIYCSDCVKVCWSLQPCACFFWMCLVK